MGYFQYLITKEKISLKEDREKLRLEKEDFNKSKKEQIDDL